MEPEATWASMVAALCVMKDEIPGGAGDMGGAVPARCGGTASPLSQRRRKKSEGKKKATCGSHRHVDPSY